MRANDTTDWEALRGEVLETFTPGTPINESELFAGRQQTIRKLQDTVLEPGRHAVVYGGRGVGKTSLANTFHRDLHRPTRQVLVERINCDMGDDFDSLWRKVFRRLKYTAQDGSISWADAAHPDPISPDDVVAEFGSFNPTLCPIVILDEFDRLQDQTCKDLTADTIKALSDFTVNCTVIIVGVARSITELLASHASITRALVEVPMARMSRAEMEAIISVRAKRLGIAFDEDATWRITYFSAGLPFFTHAFGKHAALRAISAKRRRVKESDVMEAMHDCLEDVDYSMKESYVRATEKIYRKENMFPQVLAACALADTDSLGRFTLLNVEGPLSEIMGKPLKSPAFAFHLNELCKPERGAVLEKEGTRRTYRFQFVDSRMQPYIVVRALAEGIITDSTLKKFEVKRQRELSLTSA